MKALPLGAQRGIKRVNHDCRDVEMMNHDAAPLYHSHVIPSVARNLLPLVLKILHSALCSVQNDMVTQNDVMKHQNDWEGGASRQS